MLHDKILASSWAVPSKALCAGLGRKTGGKLISANAQDRITTVAVPNSSELTFLGQMAVQEPEEKETAKYSTYPGRQLSPTGQHSYRGFPRWATSRGQRRTPPTTKFRLFLNPAIRGCLPGTEEILL